jgi:hypothetical protein
LRTQIVFAVALAVAGPVAALLAQQLTGSATLAGLAQATTVTGGVLTVLPLAALTIARGRRVAITTGYLPGALGAGAVVGAGVLANYRLLLGGAVLVGTAVSAGLQARFAAADLAAPTNAAARSAPWVWASTLGGISARRCRTRRPARPYPAPASVHRPLPGDRDRAAAGRRGRRGWASRPAADRPRRPP